MFDIVDAKTHLSQLIDQACLGEEIVIARKGRPLVRLVPVAQAESGGEAPVRTLTARVGKAP